MGRTTFSGPVRSLNGFYTQGPGSVVNLANGTNTVTLTVAAHAGKIIRTNDATLVITLPTINATTPSASAGPGTPPGSANNIGTTYTFFVETAATALKIATDGTDKFVGSLLMIDTDGASDNCLGYAPAASNDVISFNGSTTGGIAGSWVQVTVLAANKYYVTGVVLGSGAVGTPFADS